MADKITTYVSDAIARLSWQLRDKPVVQAFATVLAGRWQTFENVVQTLAAGRDLDTATGVTLDRIGHQVGQDRAGGPYPAGETDDVYRRKIKARIVVNQSAGTVEDLVAVMKALLDKCTNCGVVRTGTKEFSVCLLVTSALTSTEEADVIAFALAAKSAGEGISGICWYVSPTFGWSPGSTDPPIEGWGDGVDPSIGGAWANYFYP